MAPDFSASQGRPWPDVRVACREAVSNVGEILENLFSVLMLLGLASMLAGWLWRAWIVWQTNDEGLTPSTILTLCVPFAGALLERQADARERRPIAVLIGGLGLFLLSGYARQQLRRESALDMRQAALDEPSASVSVQAPAPPSGRDPAGTTVDLSTIMGRAQVRANTWQPEAALLGIEVTRLTNRGVDTDAGGSATFRYGPSPHRAATAGGTFVVTYDKGGLNGTRIRGEPGQPLPEPMCSPEEVYRATVGEGGTKPITLRYAVDVNGEASWHASDPSAPDVKPRVYDRQNCMPRANSKRPGR
jgi:hypothetical protein